MPAENVPSKIHSNINIRPATQADQATITAMIRAADINPLGLNWERFLVAEDMGQIVGSGQIKPHHDGSRELASIAVIPEQQHQGIASQLIEALIASEEGPLYLMCRQALESFYEQFGFKRIHQDRMPRYFRRMIRLATIFIRIASVFGEEKFEIIVMERDAT